MNVKPHRKAIGDAPSATFVAVRFAPERKMMLQAIADGETGGNLSELIRRTMDDFIASRLMRKSA